MKYYKRLKKCQIISVEAKSQPATSPGFVKTTKQIYDKFLTSLPAPPEPGPTLEERTLLLEAKVKHLMEVTEVKAHD